MKKNEQLALATADFLLQIKALKINVADPYTWTSGIKSPIYCDNRKTLSYPKVRTFIRQEMVKLINEHFSPVDVIAGVATGAIALGVLVAQDLGLPFVYVRSEKKAHGLSNQIEGVLQPGQSVVVVEDLISTGKSSLGAVAAVREAGATVKGMIAIFSYRLALAEEGFRENDVALITLTNYDALIEKALEQEYIRESDLLALEKWKLDPANWNK